MFDTSARTLRILSAVVWYGGGIVLLVKSGMLMAEAFALRSDHVWPWGLVAAGIVLGVLRGRYLFSRVCQKNLVRIESLERPKIWQFFRKRFYFLLLLMVLLGVGLSRWANHRHVYLLCVAALDLAVGVALMGSSYVFWMEKGG